ncbi:MAG TPA: protein-L-isoaspartate(D-aspartate) O-methyltransferase [candidate division Zixibacteria bacterium]|mgnify:FL=1|nr:protein-L-isoaspartate(D-aspartate) O-methyltransferase [candidate division Zixibacteria bacterium]
MDAKQTRRRTEMVEQQLKGRDIHDSAVLKAMGTVPRHRFVSLKRQEMAYHDGPLPIGCDQTISQPYIVASMTQELRLKASSRVLEIGTGCGYQAAVLAEIAREVFSIEYVPELLERARKVLKDLQYRNIHLRDGDGSHGWPERAPYDGILVTAAAPQMPEGLINQLKIGGKMVLPLATDEWGRQFLYRVTRHASGYDSEKLYEVRFVPMIGEIEGK